MLPVQRIVLIQSLSVYTKLLTCIVLDFVAGKCTKHAIYRSNYYANIHPYTQFVASDHSKIEAMGGQWLHS